MSWLRDLDGDLINLEHVQSLVVASLEEPTSAETHCISANFPGDTTPAVIDTGTEDQMRNKLELISRKLPVVKPL